MRRPASMHTDPDRRYWRRKANRRVRKARLVREAAQRALGLLPHLLLLAAVAVAVAPAARVLRERDELALSRIEIEGTARASAAAIDSRLSRWRGESLLELDLGELADAAAAEPWVRSASIKRILPDAIRVRVRERVPAAVAVIDGIAHLVDATGHVVGPTGPAGAADLPLVVGLDGLDRETRIRRLRRGVAAVTRLASEQPGWHATISEIDLSRHDRLVVRPAGEPVELWLDPERVERNVADFLALRESIETTVGPLARADLRWRGRITTVPLHYPEPTNENR